MQINYSHPHHDVILSPLVHLLFPPFTLLMAHHPAIGPLPGPGFVSYDGADSALNLMNMPNRFNLDEDTGRFHLYRAVMDDIPANATMATNDMLFELDQRVSTREPMAELIAHIRNQPVGTRTRRKLTGYTVGQLVKAMLDDGIDTRSYFLTGIMVKFEPSRDQRDPNQIDLFNNRPFVWHVERFRIFEFPLHVVDVPHTLTLTMDEMTDIDLMDYINMMRYSDAGSSLAYYIMWDLCAIKRRYGYINAIINMTYSVLTGGFPQLLTSDFLMEFTYPTCPKFDENGTGVFLKRAGRQPMTATVFIPSGQENCVQSCIRHAFVNRYDSVCDGIGELYECGNSDDPRAAEILHSVTMTSEERRVRDSEIITNLFVGFRDKYVDAKLQTQKYKKLKCSDGERVLKATREYEKMLRGGYSNTFLRKLIKHFYEESEIYLHIYYLFYDGTKAQPYRLRDRGEGVVGGDGTDRATKTHIFLFQMRIDGTIFSNEDGVQIYGEGDVDATSGEGDKTYLGFLHMITVYATDEIEFEDKLLHLLCRPKIKSAFLPAVQFTNWLCDTILIPRMKEVKKKMEYDTQTTMQSIRTNVAYQQERETSGKVPTLIFGNANAPIEVDPAVDARTKREQYERLVKRGRVAVVAYDLETVDLTAEVIDEIRPEFRLSTASTEEMNSNGGYDPVECVVPFSAQWVPVNVSYRGRMIRRAQDAGTNIEYYYAEDSLYGEYVDHPDIKPSGKVRTTDIILKRVETCYGNKKLGECVEEMLIRIAQWAQRNKFTYVFCYAHNGCGFDAYVVLRYCTFEIISILKTSRGILMLDYKVPTGVIDPKTEKEIYIFVKLRDTRVWLNGNLKRIAESFKCPPAWRKIDFPITLINHKNCYNPEVMKVCQAYGENDVLALSWVIRELNNVIGESPWDPASVYTTKPAITQFITVMSMVKAATLNHFIRETPHNYIKTFPCAIDVPVLRNWLKKATIGGRVEAYARSYVSPYFSAILTAWEEKNVNELKSLHKQMVENDGCDRVEDVTSLYPEAQSLCPMPTGRLYPITSQDHAEGLIASIGCKMCETQCKLCEHHRNDTRNPCTSGRLRPFAIILVKDLIFDHLLPQASQFELYPFCARKLENDKGLVYSLESTKEMQERLQKEEGSGDRPPAIEEIQAYTNVDLYWMRHMGYRFTVVGGFGWETSDVYTPFIMEGFEIRKKAKEEGNAVMSEFVKLQINGSYGVTAQGDIEDAGFLVTLPENLKHLHPQDPLVTQFLRTKKNRQLTHCEYLKEGTLLPNGQNFFIKAKAPGVAEYFNALSPMQIGAAVLAWSRHLVNLAIMRKHMRPMKYTDTDSICLPNSLVRWLEEKCPGVVDDSKTAALGTLKNDHLDSCGPGARVFFSIFGTKKVKLYFVLNEEGKLSICTTFKGLNPRMLDDNGMRYHMDRYEYTIAKTLFEIFYTGRAGEKEVTSWKRTLTEGVRINDHQQKFSSETYLDRSMGSFFEERKKNGLTEMFVPYGSKVKPAFYFVDKSTTPNKKDMIIAGNDRRLKKLKEYMGGRGEEEMTQFLSKFYSQRHEFMMLECEEYQKVCELILSTTVATN